MSESSPPRGRHTLWCRYLGWLWPTVPGLALPGLWLAYVTYLALSGALVPLRAILVALWPALLLYLGSCLLARSRGQARPALLIAAGLLLAAVDLGVKAGIERIPSANLPLPLLPGLLAIDPVLNVYGTMLAIPGAVPYVTALAVLMVPLTVWGYHEYLQGRPVVWGHVAFVGFFAGALAKAGDLLLRGLIVDYLHIPGLPVADLADIYLLWVGAGSAIAAALADRRLPRENPRPPCEGSSG